MNRFTTKCDSDEYIVGVTTNAGYDEDAVIEKQYEANQKLGKLEDLEEQLGCPLEVAFKALKDGIYTKKLPSGDRIKHSGLKLSSTEKGYYLFNETMCVDVRDYKVLFWLKEDKSE